MNNYDYCIQMNVYPKMSEYRNPFLNKMSISTFNIWVYIAGCSLALFIELIVIILFLAKRKLRQSPYDIFFGSLIFETLMCSAWFMTVLHQLDEGPIQTEDVNCQIYAGLNVAAHTGQMLYVNAFYYYIMKQIKTSFKAKSGRTWKLHLGVFITTALTITLLLVFELTGKEVDGLCSLQIFKLPDYCIIVMYCIFLIVYIVVGSYAMYILKKNTPQSYRVKSRKFLLFSMVYFIFYMVISLITATMQLIGSMNCQFLWGLDLDLIFGFTAVLDALNIISLPIIRSQDPYTKKILSRTFKFDSTLQSSILEQSNMEENNKVELQDIRDKSRTEDSNVIDQLQSKRRAQIMAKIIGGIQIEQSLKVNQLRIETINQNQENIFEEKKILNFRTNELVSQLPQRPPTGYMEILDQNLQMKLICYCPVVFHVIMETEQHYVDIVESLNIDNNLEKIQKAGKNDGGKSGQFFFYSTDCRLIIKTINQYELKLLLSILKNYFSYILSNKNTLITKIYGIYTIEQDNQKDIHLIVMKNIISKPSQVYRVYDLKGSSFDREVALKKDLELSKIVLKDVDFMKLERQLLVSEKDGDYIAQNAKKDSEFFKSQGLIDYSMIIFKIVNDDQFDSLDKQKQGIFQCEDTRFRYHLGIIDYLQEYNIQKAMEKYSKRFIKLNTSLDTSSQDAIIYSLRFSEFINRIAKQQYSQSQRTSEVEFTTISKIQVEQ